MKGWKYDSYRHSLAARGIRTSFVPRGIRVPPAWKNVKFHKDKDYIVTGEDKKGRVQYIYPKGYVSRVKEKKFKRVRRLTEEMPKIIDSVKQDVAKGNQEAEVVYTMYKTGFRPGGEKDTLADQQSYGVSTLLGRQVAVSGDSVKFKFTGKKGVGVDRSFRDRLLADIIRRRKVGKNRLFDTTDSKVRKYFEKKTRGRYKVKDLRTAKAQILASSLSGDKKEIGKKVSAELGNTPAVALGSYVDPLLISELK